MRTSVRLSVLGALVGVFVAGCAGSSTPPAPTTIVDPASSVAQIAVGTANIFGGTTAAVTGMNVTSTMRTPQGKSVLVNTPAITGPMKLPHTYGIPNPAGDGSTIQSGPTPEEVTTESITATPQVKPGTVTIPPSSFGISGGDFAGGFLPDNSGNVGQAFFTPYVQPLYDPLNTPNITTSSGGACFPNCDPNGFSAWGGPPAFDPNHDGQGTRDGTFGPGLPGVTQGINVFEGVKLKPGTFNLRVVIPTISTNYTIAATFNLPAVTFLGNATAPSFVPDGNGGGHFNVTMPSGATDALLNILDAGPGACNQAPAYYTMHVTKTGTYALPDSDGPGNPTHRHPTVCTAAQNAAATGSSGASADTVFVWLIGADYPIYASQYLFTLNQQTPAIVGGNGTNDITISAPVASSG